LVSDQKQFRDSELKHEQNVLMNSVGWKKNEAQEGQERQKAITTALYKTHIEFDIDCRFFGHIREIRVNSGLRQTTKCDET